MNWSKWTGIAACVAMIAACFMPWAYYDNIHKSFTGFDSLVKDIYTGKMVNYYGRQGVILIPMAGLSLAFHILPYLWAKRVNLPIAAIITALALKNFILFSSAFMGNVPTRQIGLYLVTVAAVANLIAVLFVKVVVKED